MSIEIFDYDVSFFTGPNYISQHSITSDEYESTRIADISKSEQLWNIFIPFAEVIHVFGRRPAGNTIVQSVIIKDLNISRIGRLQSHNDLSRGGATEIVQNNNQSLENRESNDGKPDEILFDLWDKHVSKLKIGDIIQIINAKNNINKQDFPRSISILKNGYCIIFRRRTNS